MKLAQLYEAIDLAGMSLAHGNSLLSALGSFNSIEFLEQVASLVNQVFPHTEGWVFEDPNHREDKLVQQKVGLHVANGASYKTIMVTL